MKYNKTRLINTLLAGLVAFTVTGQVSGSRPKLVIGIVVDQLRTDYLDYLRPLFSEGGLKLLMDSGVYMKDVDFRVRGLDKVSGTALVCTGAYPSANGIASSLVFDGSKRVRVPVLQGEGGLAPGALSLSTISDEVVIDGIALGAVHAIAADPQQAVVLGGHSAGSAVWIDPNKGVWTSSSYYKDVPRAVSVANAGRRGLPSRVDTIRWTPLRPLKDYPGIPQQKKFYPFSYSYPSSDRTSYSRLSATPPGNREVADLAVDYLNSLALGRRGETIDMLSLGFSLAPYKEVRDGDSRLELEDAYLRLDSDIARVLGAVERGPGLENTLVYVVSTGYFDDAVADDASYRIPSGEFSTKRAESLLNSYLSAKYGSGDYVECFDGTHLYLSQNALRNVPGTKEQAIADAAQFLGRMSGVGRALPLSDILLSTDPALESVRLGLDSRNAGDIIVNVLPGWTLVDDAVYPVVKTPVRYGTVSTPALVLAPGVSARKMETPVDAVSIAPTVTQLLRIRSPNGASARAIPLL